MSQASRTCKKKNIQWKIHRNKSTSLFQVTIGYNQWCPRLHDKKHTVQAIPSMRTVQAKKKKRGGKKKGMEEKVVDFKKKKEGKETKEKDIMKRRQEGGEEEKKMGTEERERRRNR